MRISELEDISYLGASGTGTNSYLIINYDTDPAPVADDTNPPVTYKVALDELGRAIASDLKLVTYDSSNGNMLNTIASNGETYDTPNVGQFATASDRTTINNIQAGYTDTNYPTTDPATSDWDKYYVKQVTNTNGTIAVTHAQFSPSLTLTDGTADNAPKIKTTVSGNESSDITLTKATTGVYGVTKLSNDTNSDSDTLAATPKALKTAITGLTGNIASGLGAGKTLATLSETNGIVSATFQNIEITSSQVNDKSDAINSDGSTLATSKAVKDAIASLKKGQATGVAELDANGLVPQSQLPSYVDDVIEGYYYNNVFYEEAAHTNIITGMSGKIYVDLTEDGARQVYRWGGTAYAAIPIGLALGDTSTTAYRGDYGAAAYAHGVTNKGSAFASGLYKITTNSEGHVTAATAVQKSDITGLGIPGDDSVMVGANGTTAGTSGLVPAPVATDNTKFLRGDGTWAIITSGGSGANLSQIEANINPAAYSSSSTYVTGDLCIHDNIIYKANTNILTAEEWDSSHWDATSLGTEIVSKIKAEIIARTSADSTINQEITKLKSLATSCGCNGFYRGKNFGTLTAENIDDFITEHGLSTGQYTDIYPGDYFKIQDGTYNVDWMVAGVGIQYYKGGPIDLNNNYFNSYGIECIPRNQGFAASTSMNGTDTAVGGYKGSNMFVFLRDTVTPKLSAILGNHLLDQYVLLSNTVDTTATAPCSIRGTGQSSNYEWTTVKCVLMNEMQVYGASVWGGPYDVGEANQMLPVFHFISPVEFGRGYYFLRDVVDSQRFASVHSDGRAGFLGASTGAFVRPLIRIG